jgi:hypothetical protein
MNFFGKIVFLITGVLVGLSSAHAAENAFQKFEKLDTNCNGILTSEEVAGLSASVADMDKNGDQRIVLLEFFHHDKDWHALRPLRPRQVDATGRPSVAGRIQRADRDGDKKLSRQEFRGPPRRFQRLDGNADGFIDAQEMAQAGRRRPPRGPKTITCKSGS